MDVVISLRRVCVSFGQFDVCSNGALASDGQKQIDAGPALDCYFHHVRLPVWVSQHADEALVW